MLLALSQVIVFAFVLWLFAVSAFCLFYPDKALVALSKFASTNFINYAELTIRLIVGTAFIGVSATSKYPDAFKLIGMFLVATALILMIIPRRWHAGYSVYWSRKIPVLAVRMLAPVSLVLGALAIGLVF